MQFQSTFPLHYHPCELNAQFPIQEEIEVYTVQDNQIDYLHYHDVLEIGYCYEGDGIFFINEKVLSFTSGNACIIFRNQYHIARSNKGTESKWDFIVLDPVALLSHLKLEEIELISRAAQGSRDFNPILTKEEQPEMIQFIQIILEELRLRSEGYQSAVRAGVWALMMKLFRLQAQDSFISEQQPVVDDDLHRIAPALNRITEQYASPLTVEELAKLCKLSTTSFRRIFQRALRVSPKVYLNRVRLKMATILLRESTTPIIEVSYRSGFQSLSSFNRGFQKELGMTPREWKSRHH